VNNNKGKNRKLAVCITAVLVLAAVLIAGCSLQKPTSATGVISDVTMSTAVDSNNQPINPISIFTADTQNLYLSFKVSDFPVGAKIEVQWIYVGGNPDAEAITGKNSVVETQTAVVSKTGSGYTSTVYSRPGIAGYENWPTGDYKIVINVDGIEKGSTTFKIQ
jgi:hypothetical protein